MKYINLNIIIFNIALLFNFANASVLEAISYDFFIETAEEIVEGTISNVKIIKYKDGSVCGWQLNIKVTRNWRGESNNVTVFTNKKYFSNGNDVEHLFILGRNYFYDDQSLWTNNFVCDAELELNAQLYMYKYRMTRPERLIFPFNNDAEKEFGGKWLTFSSKGGGGTDWLPKSYTRVNYKDELFEDGYAVMRYDEFVDTFLRPMPEDKN